MRKASLSNKLSEQFETSGRSSDSLRVTNFSNKLFLDFRKKVKEECLSLKKRTPKQFFIDLNFGRYVPKYFIFFSVQKDSHKRFRCVKSHLKVKVYRAKVPFKFFQFQKLVRTQADLTAFFIKFADFRQTFCLFGASKLQNNVWKVKLLRCVYLNKIPEGVK